MPLGLQATTLCFLKLADFIRIASRHGAVAQLGERCVRNAEVGSSILLRSTILIQMAGLPAIYISGTAIP